MWCASGLAVAGCGTALVSPKSTSVTIPNAGTPPSIPSSISVPNFASSLPTPAPDVHVIKGGSGSFTEHLVARYNTVSIAVNNDYSGADMLYSIQDSDNVIETKTQSLSATNSPEIITDDVGTKLIGDSITVTIQAHGPWHLVIRGADVT